MKLLKVVIGIILTLFMFLRAEMDHGQNGVRSQVPLPPQISYNAAYNHGCSTARGKRIKNAHAYREYAEYRRGWDAGNKACKKGARSQDDINPRNSYDIGYNHGCSTVQGNQIKNAQAYREFADYRRGWKTGYKMCKRWDGDQYDNNTLDSYSIGYNHGCSSARGNWQKNAVAFRDFNSYRRGWNTGNMDCKRSIVPATTIIQQPITEEIKIVKIVQDDMLENAKDFIRAKHIGDSLPKSFKLQIKTIQANEKYGILEFAVSYADDTPLARDDINDREYMLCIEKTDNGWDVIYDLTRSDVPSNEEIIAIKEALPEDFPLNSFLKSWMDLLNRSQQSLRK